ncbi:MAG TPA: TIR domain-containing protein [Chitinivibrionales bacterium]|nr:TIR domain-containing protein [Chitinivibrionales bacterium]
MAKKQVFVSYDYENDRQYKNLLLAWDANSLFDFYIGDASADVSIDSTNATAIKRAISAKINSVNYFLCIVGKNTYRSRWVRWEIEKASELGKKIIAVKIDRENQSPNELLNIGASWALSFTFDSIKNAIDNA